jgi:hypothetical protein
MRAINVSIGLGWPPGTSGRTTGRNDHNGGFGFDSSPVIVSAESNKANGAIRLQVII